MLMARDINKAYGSNRVLSDVDIKVAPGEILAIIGPSGSGKSTLLRALSLLDPPDSGEIQIEDKVYIFPSNGDSPPPPWPELSLVFQQLFLWPHLTVRQNMELPLRHMNDEVREELIQRLLRQYVIDDLVERYPNQLSIGQRQRVAIARTVSLKPRYLLLDEITSALDVEHIKTVLSHLRDLADSGTAIILVTHLIGFARSAASQVAFLKEGRIVESGPPERLTSPVTDQMRAFLSLVEVAGARLKEGRTDNHALPFIADSVVSELRDGKMLSDEEARYLDASPLIDALRDRIDKATDRPWLIEMLRGKSVYAAGFASSLLKPQKGDPVDSELIKVYEALWANVEPYLKNRLLWRMMEKADVAEMYHAEFIAFILGDKSWRIFRDFNLTFYGDQDTAPTVILRRLASRDEPAHKKWLYLCSVPEVVADPSMARDIVELGLRMDYPHMEEVARALLGKFWPRPDSSGPTRPEFNLSTGSMRFAAEAVVGRLRRGAQLSEYEADWLNRAPFVDGLRACIKRQDLESWVFDGLKGGRIEYAGLCQSLLRRFDEEESVAVFLREQWDTAPPLLRAHLFWGILDSSDLPMDWHERLFAFFLEHPGAFHNASLKFLGTPETIVERARERYEKEKESKKWAYLCRVAGVATNPEAARDFIRSGLHGENEFRIQVARKLMQEYYPGSEQK